MLLELRVEHVFDLANGCFIELFHGELLGLLVDLLELTLQHGASLTEVVIELLFEDLVSVHHCLLALVLADVAPARFNRGYSTRIDRIHIALGQVVKHLSIEWLVIELLRFDAIHHLASQCVHLFDELGPQVVQRDVCQVLQLVLLGQRSDHGAAVALLEETFKKTPNSILLIDGLAETFLVLKSLLEVIF